MASLDEQHIGQRPVAIARWQFLTMDNSSSGHLQQVEEACRAGIRWVQLRMKEAGEEEFLATAREARRITREWGAVLIINDRVEIAGAIGADGVHLGKLDMPLREARHILGPGMIVGGTANTAEDILAHQQDGADYIGLGPMRFTATKKKLSPILGLEGYTTIMQRLKGALTIPIVAIGGIQLADIAPLRSLGLHGVAFSGLLVTSADKQQLIASLEN